MTHMVMDISIHAPAWGATCTHMAHRCTRGHFNPRPRVGGDQPNTGGAIMGVAFQSTPPRGGRQPLEVTEVTKISISIHAPAWGATFCINF